MAIAAAVGALLGLTTYWANHAAPPSSPMTTVNPDAPLAPVTVVNPAPTEGSGLVSDRISHPPVRQTTQRGDYQLVIAADDGWKTPTVTSELYQGPTLLWQKALPHQYGPRYSLIGTNGQVLLVDEYINVASPHALTLISADGETVAQYGFDDIQTALSVSRADLTRAATSGWWVSAEPVLNEAGDRAWIQAGGATLEVDLNTGQLSRRADL